MKNIKSTPQPSTRKEREVWHVCKQLWGEDYNLEQMTGVIIGDTLENLGYKRGSNTDIHRFKRTWIEAFALKEQGAIDLSLDNNLSGPIAMVISKVERELKHQLEKERRIIEESSQEQINASKDKYVDAMKRLETIEQQNEKLRIEIEGSSKSCDVALTKLNVELKRKHILEGELSAHKIVTEESKVQFLQQIEEMKSSHASAVDVFNVRLQDIRKAKDIEIDRIVEQTELERHNWMVEKDSLEIKLKAVQLKIDDLSKSSVVLKIELKELDIKNKHMEDNNLVLGKALKNAQEEMNRKETGLNNKLTQLTISLAKEQAGNQTKDQQITDYQQQINQLQTLLSEMQTAEIEMSD